MSENKDEGGTADGLDHDAREAGPGFNNPGDEPDSESPTEQEKGDAGRLNADEL